MGDHLSVAWAGPNLNQSVIEGRYLTPWPAADQSQPAHGVLREFWTNYSAGTVVGLAGPRTFRSALTAEKVNVTVLGKGSWPQPQRVALDQNLPPDGNYRWVEMEGVVRRVRKERRD